MLFLTVYFNQCEEGFVILHKFVLRWIEDDKGGDEEEDEEEDDVLKAH